MITNRTKHFMGIKNRNQWSHYEHDVVKMMYVTVERPVFDAIMTMGIEKYAAFSSGTSFFIIKRKLIDLVNDASKLKGEFFEEDIPNLQYTAKKADAFFIERS